MGAGPSRAGRCVSPGIGAMPRTKPSPGDCDREAPPGADLTKRPGTARRPEPRAPGGGSAPMGCMHSGRGSRAAGPDGAEGPSGTADSKLRPRCKQQLRIVDPTSEVHSSESLNIRVIWRRVSIFGSRRDSTRSTKSTTSVTTLPGASDSGLESSPKEAKATGENPPS